MLRLRKWPTSITRKVLSIWAGGELHTCPSRYQSRVMNQNIPIVITADSGPTKTTPSTIPMDYEKFWADNAGITPKYLIHVDKGYIVWLDDAGDVEWQTTEAQDAEIDDKVPISEQNLVLNRAAYVNSIPVEHLTDAQRKNLRVMIGEGYARLLTLDAGAGLEMMQHAEDYVKARNAEIARGWQVIAVVGPAIVAGIALGLLWYKRDVGVAAFGHLGFLLCAGFCAGAIGAAFSVLSRTAAFALDPSAGMKLHLIEGFSRALAGSIGAVIAQLAVELSIILGIFEKGTPSLFFVALIAGGSERLVPNLVRGVENDGSSPKVKALKESGPPE